MQVSSASSQDRGIRPADSRPMSSVRAGGEQRLVGLYIAAVFQSQGDRSGAAGTAHSGDGDADPDVDRGPGQGPADDFPGERLHPGQQAVGLGQQGETAASPKPHSG